MPVNGDNIFSSDTKVMLEAMGLVEEKLDVIIASGEDRIALLTSIEAKLEQLHSDNGQLHQDNGQLHQDNGQLHTDLLAIEAKL